MQIYEYYMYTHDIFIVTEFLTGGELFQKITQEKSSLTENVIRKTMKQILSAVAYLHANQIGKFIILDIMGGMWALKIILFN